MIRSSESTSRHAAMERYSRAPFQSSPLAEKLWVRLPMVLMEHVEDTPVESGSDRAAEDFSMGEVGEEGMKMGMGLDTSMSGEEGLKIDVLAAGSQEEPDWTPSPESLSPPSPLLSSPPSPHPIQSGFVGVDFPVRGRNGTKKEVGLQPVIVVSSDDSVPSFRMPTSSLRSDPDISARSGSSRTKVIIHRAPYTWAQIAASTNNDASDRQSLHSSPASSAPSSDLLPDPEYVASRLRRRAEREKSRHSFTLGGRTKDYGENNYRLDALLRCWKGGISGRYKAREIFDTMGNFAVKLASPPPGFNNPTLSSPRPLQAKSVRNPGFAMRVKLEDVLSAASGLTSDPPVAIRKAAKRQRYSPEVMRKINNKGGTGKTLSPSAIGRVRGSPDVPRKRGRAIGLTPGSVPMTRMPSPIFSLLEDELAFPLASSIVLADSGIAIPKLPPSIDPCTGSLLETTDSPIGRRSLILTPGHDIDIDLPDTRSLISHFSPPSPDVDDKGWTQHVENVTPPLGLGLSLSDMDAEDEGIAMEMGRSANSTPSSDSHDAEVELTPEEQMAEAETRRYMLCEAIKQLAMEHERSLRLEAEQTPPMLSGMRRELAVNDTPSPGGDELITTPDNDALLLPDVEIAGEVELSYRSDDDNLPRLDKGKGKARPEEAERMELARISHDVPFDPAQNRPQISSRLPRPTQRPSTPILNVDALLEGLVIEVSKLEARQAELRAMYGEGSTPPELSTLGRRILKINDDIAELSKTAGLTQDVADSVAPYVSDEMVALRLQDELDQDEEDEEATMNSYAWAPVPGARIQDQEDGLLACSTMESYPALPAVQTLARLGFTSDVSVSQTTWRNARQLTFGLDSDSDSDNEVYDQQPQDAQELELATARRRVFEAQSHLDAVIESTKRARERLGELATGAGPPQESSQPVQIIITPPTPDLTGPQSPPACVIDLGSVSEYASALEAAYTDTYGIGDMTIVTEVEVEEDDLAMESADGDSVFQADDTAALFRRPWAKPLDYGKNVTGTSIWERGEIDSEDRRAVDIERIRGMTSENSNPSSDNLDVPASISDEEEERGNAEEKTVEAERSVKVRAAFAQQERGDANIERRASVTTASDASFGSQIHERAQAVDPAQARYPGVPSGPDQQLVFQTPEDEYQYHLTRFMAVHAANTHGAGDPDFRRLDSEERVRRMQMEIIRLRSEVRGRRDGPRDAVIQRLATQLLVLFFKMVFFSTAWTLLAGVWQAARSRWRRIQL